jgi:hypothetical protein
MATEQKKERVVIVKDGEVLAMLERGVLYVVDLHCEEIPIVWYSLLAQAA